MNRGAFDFITKPVNFEDLDLTIIKTIRHVTQTRQTLKAIRENNILRMYVDETVLNFMNRPEFESSLLKNETIEATVAFIDICGFTSITETEQPNVVVNMLNSYFDVIVKEIIAQNGYVDKFIGDAVLAVFRNEFHLDRAMDACLAVRTQIEKIFPDPNGLEFLPKGFHRYSFRRNDQWKYWFSQSTPVGLYRYWRCGEYCGTITFRQKTVRLLLRNLPMKKSNSLFTAIN